jgi:cytochrome c-type biogenesis protein CcmF
MVAEVGHFALVLAIFVALAQAVLPLWGARTGDGRLVAVARPAAQAQFLLVATAFAALAYSFVVSDFSVSVVAQSSHATMPLLYKLTGVWGNHEGSMVLWVLILTLFGAGVATFGRGLPRLLQARVLAIQSLIGVGFLVFIVATSNPFSRIVPPPADGRGLNPLLQDPGLAFHPPFLYIGYVGFSIAFSFAIAALIEGRIDAVWARWVRPWTLVAWCSLTLGIGLGSWWAYYELGWGGWWFWDPVENASFMPWLVGTALLHSAVVVEKRDTFKGWTVLLAIITFSLSLIGTFLVRSGVLSSVHAFATDPARGVFILGLLTATIGGALFLYALRAPLLRQGGLFQPISREGAITLNNLLLCTAAATVFVGTLYPLILDAFTGRKVSVGAPFFDATFSPLLVPLLIALPMGAMLPWKRGDLAAVIQRLRLAIAVVAIAALVVWYVHRPATVGAIFGVALAVWLVAGALVELAERVQLFRIAPAESWRRARNLGRAAYGMAVAHAGLGVLLAGIVALSAWKEERIQVMGPGDSVTIAGYTLVFQGVQQVQGPNYMTSRGTFSVRADGRAIAQLYPEKRFYPVARMPTTEAAIRTTGLSDLYVVLGDPQPGGSWATRIYYNPLAPWLWAGIVIMVLGGLISLSDRRYRVGAPAGRRRLQSVGISGAAGTQTPAE